MNCLLFFVALVASVSSTLLLPSPLDLYHDSSAPENSPEPAESNSTEYRQVSLDITIDLSNMMGDAMDDSMPYGQMDSMPYGQMGSMPFGGQMDPMPYGGQMDPMMDNGFILTFDSDPADTGIWGSCSYQLVAVAGVAVLLVILISIELYSLYIKRRSLRDHGVVQLKNTV